MLRLLTLLLFAFLLSYLVDRQARRFWPRTRDSADRSARGAGEARHATVDGELVPCARCGVRLLRARATRSAGLLFCSEECRSAGEGGAKVERRRHAG